MADAQSDGGQAFPGEDQSKYFRGMSLLDYYAGQAMIGFMNDLGGHIAQENDGTKAAAAIRHTARLSYMVADAMLTERERNRGR